VDSAAGRHERGGNNSANQNCKTCNAPVKIPPQTLSFLQTGYSGCPSCCPTTSKHDIQALTVWIKWIKTKIILNKTNNIKLNRRNHTCVSCYKSWQTAFTDWQSWSSHCRVWMFISIVRLALVTSVMYLPPCGPPVKFYTTANTTFNPQYPDPNTENILTNCQTTNTHARTI